MSDTTIHPAIQKVAELIARSTRTPILRRPDEYGMKYEDVFFPSLDGLPLEGWFIPADSDRLVICNHFLPGNRYGFPGHLEPWKSPGIGDFEVNVLPAYKALHDAGYNVLAKEVTVPTLVVQVHDDATTKSSDVQQIYDKISAADKKLFWIEGTTRRFDGYNYFAQNPQLMLDWFGSHMA